MKSYLLLLLAFLPVFSFSQNYSRRLFEYDKLKQDTNTSCSPELMQRIDSYFQSVQENNSSYGVKMAKMELDSNKNCPQIFDIYGYSLFRSGEWFEGLEIIEKGIDKFGPEPNLIKRKSEMSLEMADLGTGQKNIDGSSVYKVNSIPFEEQQFKKENLHAALIDLEYLAKEYNRSEEKYFLAKTHQLMENYEKSNEVFATLIGDEEYGISAIFSRAENDISMKKYADAENEINVLLVGNPKEWQLFGKLAEIYELKNEKEKSLVFKKKSIYYRNIPSCSNLAFSDENYALLSFFGSDENNAKTKLKKLNELAKNAKQDSVVDICLMILKLHANHGNGIEEKATEILAKIGKPAIEKVNFLFQTNVSTCTITNLAEIMATAKDEQSWELLKTYLPQIANMPMTLIPPDVPEMMIKFDEERGLKEILLVVKNLLQSGGGNADPMSEMNAFGQYVYFSPLKKVNKAKLKKIASELNYSEQEFTLLEAKIK